MHGTLFAVGMSCCTGTALGDRRPDTVRVAVRPAACSPAKVDTRAFDAAARVGGDSWIESTGPGLHIASKFGAGGGVGVAIDRVHLGLSAMYYLAADGSSESKALVAEGGAVYWSLLVGTELGYDFRV